MYRVGFSKDIHFFSEGKEITLGGIKIACDKTIDAYSDGDVLLHSLCEAFYGAMGMEDIGTYFSSKNMKPSFNSTEIVKEIKQNLLQKNYLISNIDILVIVDEPNLKNHKILIKKSICNLFEVNLDQVAIKATNTDGYEKTIIQVYSNVLIYEGEKSDEI